MKQFNRDDLEAFSLVLSIIVIADWQQGAPVARLLSLHSLAVWSPFHGCYFLNIVHVRCEQSKRVVVQ